MFIAYATVIILLVCSSVCLAGRLAATPLAHTPPTRLLHFVKTPRAWVQITQCLESQSGASL